ncbi:hypothetical protein PsYK624_077690 [Phanerochaete sordida]|uniref:Uncharacterized protein n=1 Tax=Phanerochaete sordida TaxID=48140 RepID=A0A9P3GC28_9APHY|nr:hypothetical protein PsYK624_077690 [Phanerochaete sordida]
MPGNTGAPSGPHVLRRMQYYHTVQVSLLANSWPADVSPRRSRCHLLTMGSAWVRVVRKAG